MLVTVLDQDLDHVARLEAAGIAQMHFAVDFRGIGLGAAGGADAVMMLRIQTERITESLFPTGREYSRYYGLSRAKLDWLKPDALVLHPGPINRGVELEPEVADGPNSVILDQVENGVAVRMAILLRAAGEAPAA